jgi:uncharacterized protein (TIGR00251 family)
VIIEVSVKPKARGSSFQRADDGSYVARVASAPVDGKANAELIALVAAHFGCRKSAVSIVRGASARRKLVKIEHV